MSNWQKMCGNDAADLFVIWTVSVKNCFDYWNCLLFIDGSGVWLKHVWQGRLSL